MLNLCHFSEGFGENFKWSDASKLNTIKENRTLSGLEDTLLLYVSCQILTVFSQNETSSDVHHCFTRKENATARSKVSRILLLVISFDVLHLGRTFMRINY